MCAVWIKLIDWLFRFYEIFESLAWLSGLISLHISVMVLQSSPVSNPCLLLGVCLFLLSLLPALLVCGFSPLANAPVPSLLTCCKSSVCLQPLLKVAALWYCSPGSLKLIVFSFFVFLWSFNLCLDLPGSFRFLTCCVRVLHECPLVNSASGGMWVIG